MIIHNDRQELQKALQYVEEELKKYNLNRREATMTMLMAEESLVCMMSHTEEQEKIEIVFKKLFGNISLNISARGEAFNMSEESVLIGDMDFEGVSGDAEAAIRNLIIRSQSDIFQYKNRLHQNTIRLIVKRSERMQLYLTLGAMLFSIILGIALKLLCHSLLMEMYCEYHLLPHIYVLHINHIYQKYFLIQPRIYVSVPSVPSIHLPECYVYFYIPMLFLSDKCHFSLHVRFLQSRHISDSFPDIFHLKFHLSDTGSLY